MAWSPPAVTTEVSAATPGPIAHWSFDEGSGSTVTDSVGGLTGAVGSGVSWVTSGAPQGTGALSFDGSPDGLVAIANDPTLEPSGASTVVLWVRAETEDVRRRERILQKGAYGCEESSWNLGFDLSFTAQVRLTDFGYSQAVGSNYGEFGIPGIWRRVAIIHDPANGRSQFWIDGVKTIPATYEPDSIEYGAVGRTDDRLLLGGPGTTCDHMAGFRGTIDDLRLYDRALTDQEVLDLTPVRPTTTTVQVLQNYDEITEGQNALPLRVHAIISPIPGVDADTIWYASKDGGPESVVATTRLDNPGSGVTVAEFPAGHFDAGSYTLRAAWQGSSNWMASSSPPVSFTLRRQAVSMSLTPSAPEEVPGGSSTLMADVTVIDPPRSVIVGVDVEFYDTTGGREVLLGRAPIVSSWMRQVAALTVDDLPAGTRTYRAVFPGTKTVQPAHADAAVLVGMQRSVIHFPTPGPVMNTQNAVAYVDLFVSRNTGTEEGLPPPSGLLTVKQVSTGAVVATATVDAARRYTLTLPTFAEGTVRLVAEYSGDARYGPSTSNHVDLTVVADTVGVAGVGVGYSTFYPVKDGYRDAVSIKGTRHEPISVSVRVYNPSGKLVKTFTVPEAFGAYALTWNGRNSAGTILAAGTYKVVQVLTDDSGTRLVVNKTVTLSHKKIYYYTKTLTKLGTAYSSVGALNGASITRYSDGSVRFAAPNGWAGAGWQFALPSAPVYKSISIGVYGYGGAQLGSFGAQNFSVCPYSSSWIIECFDRMTSLPSSTQWKGRSISPTANQHKGIVRLAVSQTYGTSRIYKVRVNVTYGLLK